MHEVMSRMQWAAFLEWTVSKKLISKKEASKLETLVNQAQKFKKMKNLVDDKKMDKSKHETFDSHLKKCTNILHTKTCSKSL